MKYFGTNNESRKVSYCFNISFLSSVYIHTHLNSKSCFTQRYYTHHDIYPTSIFLFTTRSHNRGMIHFDPIYHYLFNVLVSFLLMPPCYNCVTFACLESSKFVTCFPFLGINVTKDMQSTLMEIHGSHI